MLLRMTLLALALTLALPAAHAAELNVAASDIGAGSQPAGGALVDVIHVQRRLEQAFANQGVTVNWHFFKGAAPQINEAFASGQVDVAYLGDLGALIGRSAGLDTHAVAVAARGIAHYLAVPPGSPVHSLSDLKGKTVGLFRGTAAQLSFIGALRTAGMTERDVRIINLDFGAASAALAGKQIDATWGGANVLALRDRGQAEIPLSTRTLGGAGDLAGLVVVSGRLLREHPEWARTVVEVQQQAAAWASQPENRNAYLQLLANQAAYPLKLLEEDLEGAPALSALLAPGFDPGIRQQLRSATDIARAGGMIRRDVDLEAWITTP